ncbi:MAG: flagellar brake protein [Ammonifex sp.]|jgi:c-di-GMP-binding flagellar brake protein YcgR|nr:MAG: flagellar brake protein [Ammonifex sp.]
MERISLSINQRIEVSLEGSEEYYVSAVEDITSDMIFIAVPYRNQTPLMFSEGDRVLVNYTGDSELFSFTSTVVGRRQDKVLLYGISFPEKIQRVQRRRDVRLCILHDVFCAEIPQEDEPPVFKKTKALDISASGLRLVTDKPFAVGTRLLVKFKLPVRDAFYETETKAEVKRQEPILIDNQMVYHLGMEFIGLPQSQKDKIFSYIFWKMMEQKRLQ